MTRRAQKGRRDMKNSIIISCMVGLLCLAQQSVGAEENGAEHDALRALRDRAEQAINAGDMVALRGCLAKEFTFVTSEQTVLTDMPGVEAYWDGMFKNEKSPVTAMKSTFTADILTTFMAPNIGYCRGTSRDVYTLRNKRKVAVQNRWTTVLIKEDGAWKISTAHIGINFLDNPVLKAREMSWIGKLGVALKLRKMPGEVKE